MAQPHSLFAYLERQRTEVLQHILLQEFNKNTQQNTILILIVLYLLEERGIPQPPHIIQAWNQYLESATAGAVNDGK